MSDAPKQIWATTGLYYDYVQDWSEGEWGNNDDCGGTKYVRADVADELLEALKDAIEVANTGKGFGEWGDKARAAIAKAEGTK